MIDLGLVLKCVRQQIIPYGHKVSEQLSAHEKKTPLAIAAEFLLKKSTKTLKAVCLLAEKDFGEDAQVLARTLFENALVFAFICKPPDDCGRNKLAQLFIFSELREQERKQKQVQELRDQGKCRNYTQPMGQLAGLRNEAKEPSANEAQKVKQELVCLEPWFKQYLNRLGKKVKNGQWSELSLRNMSQIVGEPFECDYIFLYWSVSNLVHASPVGSFSYSEASRPNDKWGEVGRAMCLAVSFYYHLCRSTVSMLMPQADASLEEEFKQWVELLKDTEDKNS